MRKRTRIKRGARHRCVCKPYKVGFGNRWRPREEMLLREFERTWR